ncbi:MAG: hypothetical protein JSR17_04535 [Proteobacteria bacterium]|nr:hypothetical protein [Pseudomonadota bacterium]
MAQVHPFTNPFLKSTQGSSSFKPADPFMPYQAFFAFNAKNNPFAANEMSQHWAESQRKLWQDAMEYFSWQQNTMQQNMVDSGKVMMHCMQLSANPPHLYRYIRRNWQKPYVTLGAQYLHGAKLYTQLISDYLCAVQTTCSHH